jgi:hypothetical protein
MSEQPSLDVLLQEAAIWKDALSDCYNALSGLALILDEMGQAGAMASLLVASTQEVRTWADVYAIFGPDAIESTDPLYPAWWRAVLKTDDPAHWLEQARARQLNAAQIRAEAGVKQERRAPVYDGSGTLDPDKQAVWLDSVPAGGHRRVSVRLVEKETQ